MHFIKNSIAGFVLTKHRPFWRHGNFLHPPQRRLLRPVLLQQENSLQIATISSLVTEDTAMCKEGRGPSIQWVCPVTLFLILIF